MSITVGVSVVASTVGLDGLIARLSAPSIEAVVETFANLIAERARELAPVDTGALRDSIAVHLGEMAAEIAAGDGLTDGRAVYQELGFHSRDGKWVQHPYLVPALLAYQDQFRAAIQALVRGG